MNLIQLILVGVLGWLGWRAWKHPEPGAWQPEKGRRVPARFERAGLVLGEDWHWRIRGNRARAELKASGWRKLRRFEREQKRRLGHADW